MADTDPEKDELVAEIERRAERHRRWEEAGEDSMARRLGQIGVLGWMIVTPILVGVFLGRWLDTRAGSGLTWTGALLMLGTALGCWSAWRWMHHE